MKEKLKFKLDVIRIGDYFTVEPHVRGRFDGIDDTFDPARGHAVALTIKAAWPITQ